MILDGKIIHFYSNKNNKGVGTHPTPLLFLLSFACVTNTVRYNFRYFRVKCIGNNIVDAKFRFRNHARNSLGSRELHLVRNVSRMGVKRSSENTWKGKNIINLIWIVIASGCHNKGPTIKRFFGHDLRY